MILCEKKLTSTMDQSLTGRPMSEDDVLFSGFRDLERMRSKFHVDALQGILVRFKVQGTFKSHAITE